MFFGLVCFVPSDCCRAAVVSPCCPSGKSFQAEVLAVHQGSPSRLVPCCRASGKSFQAEVPAVHQGSPSRLVPCCRASGKSFQAEVPAVVHQGSPSRPSLSVSRVGLAHIKGLTRNLL